MQTGDCAGFGKQPNATARRLLSRALWVGGLAVAGSVFAAATANAAEAEPKDEASGGLVGTLTSAIELSGSVVDETGTLLTDDLAVSEDLLGDGSLVGEEFDNLVNQPAGEFAEAVGLEELQHTEPGTRERAAERDRTIAAPTDRSMRRAPIEVAAEDGAASDESATESARADQASLIGAVDRLLSTTADAVPDAPSEADAEGGIDDVVGALTSGIDLQPLEPLLSTLEPVMSVTAPDAVSGALIGQAPPEMVRPVPAARSTLDQTTQTSAATAPRNSHDEYGAARAAGQDGEFAVIHSSLDAGMDGQDPFTGPRGGLRPSLLVTPVAGLSVLHMGAPGAATSADQAGPSGLALLPEEAVLRARLFSAAAYARNAEVKPLREANDPPVSPD